MKIFLIFTLLFLMSDCEGPVTPVTPNIETKVRGHIYGVDKNWKKKGVSDIKIKVSEYLRYQNGFPNPSTYEFIQFVDSTFTDENGDYNLSFSTTGEGSNYFIEIVEPSGYHFFTQKKEIDSLGKTNTIQDIQCRILYPVELQIETGDITTYPILLRNNTYWGSFQPDTLNNPGIHNLITWGLGQNEPTNDTLELIFGLEGIGYGYKKYYLDIPNNDINYDENILIELNEEDFD